MERPFGDGSGSALIGTVYDSKTKEPLGWTQLQLPKLQRGVTADADGSYRFADLPPGSYSLSVSRIGYLEYKIDFTIQSNDTTVVDIYLSDSPLTAPEVMITSSRDHRADAGERIDLDLTDQELQRERGQTIAETMQHEPGVAMRAMGPATARPVLRGLGSDRLLLLENGLRIGDLSETSSDHAVTIDPLTMQSVEVIRGPGALAYGSSVMGGVINVVRHNTHLIESRKVSGSFLLSGASANNDLSASAKLSSQNGPFSMSGEGSLKSADDLYTPIGRLKNTDITTRHLDGGVGLTEDWGVIQVSGGLYSSDYGVPGGFVGAHPNGADIEIDRRQFTVRMLKHLTHSLFRSLEASYNYSWYHHTEFESDGSVGVEFGVLTDHFNLKSTLGSFGPFSHGHCGLWIELRDYANGGLSFTPNSDERAVAAYWYESLPLHSFTLDAAIRADTRAITPDENNPYSQIGSIRERSFAGVSAALSLTREWSAYSKSGLTLMRSFRSPRIEELFSEGPHLAAFSYEIGNPELVAETGTGVELFTQFAGAASMIRGSLYHNRFDDYIFPQETGRMSPRRNDLREFQVVGQDAAMTGFDAEAEHRFARHWTALFTSSYVFGDLLHSAYALPWMPPLQGSASLKWTRNEWLISAAAIGAARQNRLGEFEEPTAAYLRCDISAQYSQSMIGMQNLFTLAVQNVFDTEYRDHLNRVKSISPEAGTNVKLSLLSSF